MSLSGTGAVAGDSVQLYNGTTPLGSAVSLSGTNISNGFVDITTAALSNGTTYNFRAAVIDAAGNTSAESTDHAWDITIDTTPPAALWTYSTSAKTITVLTDATNIASVTAVDNTHPGDLTAAAVHVSGGTWTISSSVNINGDNVTVTVTDTAGNVTTSTHNAPAGVAGEPINLGLSNSAGSRRNRYGHHRRGSGGLELERGHQQRRWHLDGSRPTILRLWRSHHQTTSLARCCSM